MQQVRIPRNGDGHGNGDDGWDGYACDGDGGDGAGAVPAPAPAPAVVVSGEGSDVGGSGDGDGDDGDGDGDGEGACGGHPAASSQTCSRKIGRWVIHLRSLSLEVSRYWDCEVVLAPLFRERLRHREGYAHDHS